MQILIDEFRKHTTWCNYKWLIRNVDSINTDITGISEVDFIVIGSGIGGLCCGSLLARYGEGDVLVLESHDSPGGVAHSFEIKGYHFDSGPSLFSGLSSRGLQANPLAQVWFGFSWEK